MEIKGIFKYENVRKKYVLNVRVNFANIEIYLHLFGTINVIILERYMF